MVKCFILGLIIGLLLGGALGIVILCLLQTAGKEDALLEKEMRKQMEDINKSKA